MLTADHEHILRVLGEATQPLFVSEITDCLNRELSSGPAFDNSEILRTLQPLYEQVALLGDGRWTLKRRVG